MNEGIINAMRRIVTATARSVVLKGVMLSLFCVALMLRFLVGVDDVDFRIRDSIFFVVGMRESATSALCTLR